MYKIAKNKPDTPFRHVYTMSSEGCEAHRKLEMDSNVYEVCKGVLIAGDSKTGKIKVSSNETNRYQIVHAKIFEKNIIQHYGFVKMTNRAT